MSSESVFDIEIDPKAISTARTAQPSRLAKIVNSGRICSYCHTLMPAGAVIVLTKANKPVDVECLVSAVRKWLMKEKLLSRETVVRVQSRYDLAHELRQLQQGMLNKDQQAYIEEQLALLTVN